MLIWLNGPFGVGKTSGAEALVKRLPGALLYDAELVGAMLRRIVGGIDPIPDFQDLAVWRALVPETARRLRDAYRCSLVMPLTVWRRDYFDELAAALRTVDKDLRCFRLTAAEQVLRARIIGRPTSDGPHDWCLTHVPTGLALMRETAFGEEIATDSRSPDQIAEAIVAALEVRTAVAD
ncbi:MAG: AAA family ATPase [Chloroflexota bacterium]|nr:AAA family ATPase [Chloroflexota bacterium]